MDEAEGQVGSVGTRAAGQVGTRRAALEAEIAKTFQRAQFDVVGWHRAAEMRLAEHAAKFTIRVK